MDAEMKGDVFAPVKLEDVKVKIEESELATELPKPAGSVIPETPDVKVKIEESELDLKPLASDLPKAFDSASQDNKTVTSDGASPRTPKHLVFDPFAPGPEHLLLAPRCPRNNEETLISIAWFLDCHQSPRLEGGDKDHVASDEEILAALYRMLLKVVLSDYAEKLLAESLKSAPNGDGTPTSAPVSTGTDGGCPVAPKKLGKMLVNMDRDLCKKLDF